MLLAVLAVLGLAWWLHQRGELLPSLKRWGAVAALGLLALRLLETGKVIPAAIAGAAAAFWWYAGKQGLGEFTAVKRARLLLGTPDDADAEAIHAAWRRRVTTAHPDAGGDAVAMQAATDARDLLLGRLRRR